MRRCKLTTYVTPDIAETLARLAVTEIRSVSDIVEDAIVQKVLATDRGAQQAAIIASLAQVSRRLAALERNLETHFELAAQSTRFLLSVTPDIPEADRASWSARGRDRLNTMLSVVIARLSAGRSTLKAAYNAPQHDAAASSDPQETAP